MGMICDAVERFGLLMLLLFQFYGHKFFIHQQPETRGALAMEKL